MVYNSMVRSCLTVCVYTIPKKEIIAIKFEKMSSMLDLRIRTSKKNEQDLDSRIHSIVFPEEQEFLYNQILEQMMMDGYAPT